MLKKEKRKFIVELLIVFIIILSYNIFFYSTYDYIIDFTHVYSIANGLKIYKDFNIVIGPIYPSLISLFMILLGKNFLTFNIINSLFVVFIYFLIKTNNKNTSSLLIIIIFHNLLISKYNTFTLLLFYIIYFLELKKYKYKDYLIGFTIAITIFTKINIGLFLIIPSILLYYKEPKIIFKRLITIITTSLLILLILFANGLLPDFLNYTVYGLFDFLNHSTSAKDILFIPMVIILLIAIFYTIRDYHQNKMLSYMLSYLIMAFPIFDYHHTILAIIPIFIYFIDKKNYSLKNRKIMLFITCIFYIGTIFYNFKTNPITKIDCQNKYCSMNNILNNTFDKIHQINLVLQEQYHDYQIFYFNDYAYLYKLDLHQNINKYDYIWRGNMGYDGENKYIEEVDKYCKNNKCLFIIDENNIINYDPTNNISKKIIDYVTNTYQKEKYILYNNATIYTNDNIIKEKEN